MKRLIKMITFLFIFLFTIFTPGSANAQDLEGCTIGVASGKAASDGRPLLWKTRDTSDQDNEVYFNSSYRYKFVSVITARSTTAWMGVNDKGFAILNAVADDLPAGSAGSGNGTIMTYALGNFATVSEFEQYLINTNITGRTSQSNFGVIDSTGAAAIFEVGGNVFWKFDANDSTIAPNGYVLRTNFAFNGAAKDGINNGIYSIERFRRTEKLISDFYSGDSVNYRSILRTQMRDFSDFDSQPVSVPFPAKWQSNQPYGYIYCYVSICRSTSVSAVVFQGVLPNREPAKLSTMWTILGQPASGIAVPYWPVGKAPKESDGPNTAPLCDIANQIRTLLFDYPDNSSYLDSYKLRDGNGGGLWAQTLPAEDSIFAATETRLEQWRAGTISISEMLATESELASYALETLQKAYSGMTTVVAQHDNPILLADFSLDQNYPNPFNAATTIKFYLPEPCHVTLKIFNSLGQEVETLVSRSYSLGNHQAEWDASDLASGVYIYSLAAQPVQELQKPIFIDARKLILTR
ncbi:MAG TPA: T9SS type A sorting domain-containing protein [bacterium]